MSELFNRKDVMVTITTLSFLTIFIPYFFKIPMLDAFSTKVATIASLINSFTLVLAVHSQFKRGLNIMRAKGRGWFWAPYQMIWIVIMVIFGIIGTNKEPWHFIMFAVVNPLSSVNYSILAFYLSSAAARAFRARSLNATLLLITGAIVLIYQAPMTGTIFPGIEPVALYFSNTFAMAVSRTMTMGMTVAAIILGVKTLIGREVQFLGFTQEE